jgi:glycosyltransferase involved in cell wall biosynthesis
MLNLLFLSPELPYPPQSGGKLKSLRLLDALAERYNVTLVSPLKADDAGHRSQFAARSRCRAHLHRRVDVKRSARSLIASYLRGVPLNVHRSYDAVLAEQVRQLAGSQDLIVVDHYEMAPYVPRDFRGTVIYHAHNAYHQLWNRYARLPGNPLIRAAAQLEAWRVRRAETALARRSDLVFAAPNDARFLAGAGVSEARIAHTYHLGDDSQLGLPPLSFDDSALRLMYVGFLGWEANTLGLLWFLENVWPRLLEVYPDLGFDIVGKDPDERLRALAEIYPGVRLHGFVDDLQSVYGQARVSVAPLLFGSGMKVKVLDAMARGMPTVTTPVGAEGIDAVNGCHLAVADSAAAMAEAVLELLENRAQWSAMSAASRELVRERYTWRALFDHMHGAIAATLRDAGRQPLPQGEGNPALQHG